MLLHLFVSKNLYENHSLVFQVLIVLCQKLEELRVDKHWTWLWHCEESEMVTAEKISKRKERKMSDRSKGKDCGFCSSQI